MPRSALSSLRNVAFALLLVALSARLTERFFDPITRLAFLALSALILSVICHELALWMRSRPALPNRHWLTLSGSVALVVFLIVSFAVLYPLANSGRLGPGSDRDEALESACANLLAGRHPYSQLTYLNNPVTAMPGEVFLALPFSLTGCVAVQNVFWMAALVLVLAHAAGGLSRGTLATCLLLFGSPEVLREYVTGGDMGTTAVMVLCGVYLLLTLLKRKGAGWSAAAVLLGLALSSRPIYLLLLPLLGTRLFAVTAPGRAVLALGLVLGVFALVTLPLYLASPEAFTPLTVAGKLGVLRQYLPFADLLIYSATAIAALGSAAVWAWRSATAFFWSCGAIMALPLVLGELLLTLGEGRVYFTYFPYLHVAIYFSAVAWVWREKEPRAAWLDGTFP